jgi:hypothetical protein
MYKQAKRRKLETKIPKIAKIKDDINNNVANEPIIINNLPLEVKAK